MEILKWKGLDIDPMQINESVTSKVDFSQIDTNFSESTQESGITVLYPKIEAIHAGRTRNYNVYTAEKLKGNHELRSGVYSWTQPFPKPVIYNHDTTSEASGRVHSASFTEFTQAGRPGIIVTPKITQESAIKGILEGRLLTVSIGATTNAAVCSVCSTDIINEGWCGHMRGEEYEGQMCEWVAGDLFFDELSWVNVPADSDAMILGTGLTNNTMQSNESKIIIKDDASDISEPAGTPIPATNTENINTKLTAENEVVKKVSESKEKEDDEVEDKDKVVEPEVTPAAVIDEPTVDPAAAQAPVVTEEPAIVADPVVVTEEPEATPAAVVTEDDEALAEELAQTKLELKDALETVEELKNANEQLVKTQQESTVNFLVDLRMAIGKESNREEAVEKFAARSMESLNDSISDILAEKPAIETTRTVEQVVKPTGVAITESKTLATTEGKVISNEDMLLSLLGVKQINS